VEEYQEEIEFTRFLFYEGTAFIKYGGEYNRYQSEISGKDQFKHVRYYDVRIKNIKQLKEVQYKEWDKLFQLSSLQGEVIADYNGEEYTLDTDVLYIEKALELTHNQVEGEELHGFFKSVKVCFKMNRPETAIVCKKDFPSGKEEQRDDGLYKEFYTGEYEDEVNNICATEWRNVSIPFPPEPPTPTPEPPAPTPTPTPTPPTPPPPTTGCTDGCSDAIGWLLILALASIPIWLAIAFQSFMPILFGIGIPLLFYGLAGLLTIAERFPKITSFIGTWLLRLFGLLIVLSLLNGIVSLFTHRSASTPKQQEYSKEKNWELEHIDPEGTYDGGNNNGNNTNETKDQTKGIRSKIKVKLKWKSLNGKNYEGEYGLYKDEIAASRANINQLKNRNYSTYNPVYKSIYNKDKEYLDEVYLMLDSIQESNKLSRREFANVITTMVQSIEYVLILDVGCNDASLYQNKEISEMLRAGVKCDGYAPYGIKTPMEFLSTMKGDCDTRTLLLYTLFKHYKYKVAIINSEFYGHSMLGLSQNASWGAYKKHNDVKYYFWETTNEGYSLGKLPAEMGNLNFWQIEIN
jgi:hypothetical protein